MITRRWMRCLGTCGMLALFAGGVAPGIAAQQAAPPAAVQVDDKAGFKEFTDRVQIYVTLQKTVESKLPALKTTELPELIAAHQHALARKIREARSHAKPGDLFTAAARGAFSRACASAGSATSRAYTAPDAANPRMHLEVNDVYPGTEPVTSMSPELLAAFPPLPAEVVYRIVGRTLVLVDVKSRLIVDLARAILPPTA